MKISEGRWGSDRKTWRKVSVISQTMEEVNISFKNQKETFAKHEKYHKFLAIFVSKHVMFPVSKWLR